MLQFAAMKIAKKSKGSKRSRKASVKDRLNPEKKRIASEVKLYIEERGISRFDFGKMINRHESTLNHFFAGGFSDSLLARVERALGRQFRKSSSTAPAEWGNYTRESVAKFVGSFLTLRNDFKDALQICAYVTTIEWGNIEQAHMFDGRLLQKPKIDGYGLIFREERRKDPKYTHRGGVWFPGGQYLYLVTAYGDGRLRGAIVSVPDNDKMTGIQLSLHNPKGAAYMPAAAPIALLRREKIEDDELGYFLPGQARYEDYKRILSDALNDVAFVLPVPITSLAQP